MSLPSPETPLYNHPLPDIEDWLTSQGCVQNREELNCWQVNRSNWKAELCLDIDQLVVRYSLTGEADRTIQRSFKYSLSRKDIEDAVFAGP